MAEKWLAVGALAVAAIAIVVALAVWSRLARMRAVQHALVGSGGRADFVEFAVTLQGRVDDLQGALDEVAAAISRVDRRIDGTLSRTSLVRYDAYADTGGHQSASVAILDSARSGIVLTAIQGRDYARIYVKEVDRGRSSVALSPEEQDAVERAMSPGSGP